MLYTRSCNCFINYEASVKFSNGELKGLAMEDVKKKCVLCGSEFIATDDNKPNHQICCRCSQQLTRHINPKISKNHYLMEIIFFILCNIWTFIVFTHYFKDMTVKNMFKLDNSLLLISVISSAVMVIFTVINFYQTKKNP